MQGERWRIPWKDEISQHNNKGLLRETPRYILTSREKEQRMLFEGETIRIAWAERKVWPEYRRLLKEFTWAMNAFCIFLRRYYQIHHFTNNDSREKRSFVQDFYLLY